MKTTFGHLTYCTNIHAGETWVDHFSSLRDNIPVIKQNICPDKPFGIGLRLSNIASIALVRKETLQEFKQWLNEQQCYVFTMNGFPFGSFHHTVVKDKVHAPDWTNKQRADYTIRLAEILVELLPDGMDGGISTSPLSYRHWHKTAVEKQAAFKQSTMHLLQVLEALILLKGRTGNTVHIDIEPEPDGLLETGAEFLEWYHQYLLPMGYELLHEKMHYSKPEAEKAIKEHIQLCYDVCHFAVGYEEHRVVLQQLKQHNIKVGKIQVSAALKGVLAGDREERKKVVDAFENFNETTYLHQVVAKGSDGGLIRHTDLPQALQHANDNSIEEWRAHFHVPVFLSDYGVLQSTQGDIQEVLRLHSNQPFTSHIEIETYTWEVLPKDLKLPVAESVCREIDWLLTALNVAKEIRNVEEQPPT